MTTSNAASTPDTLVYAVMDGAHQVRWFYEFDRAEDDTQERNDTCEADSPGCIPPYSVEPKTIAQALKDAGCDEEGDKDE